MRVLFINRTTIFSIPGGDTIQMLFTAKELELLGVQVDFFDKEETYDYARYDLLHFFNITRPASILKHIENTDKPFVVSTIYADYSFYSKLNLFSKMGILTAIFGGDGIEYVKAFAKHFLGKEKIPYTKYLRIGQRNSIKKILKKASYILPNSLSENNRLQTRYKTNIPFKVIPNGVDLDKFKVIKDTKRIDKNVLCVALIEPRKNQYNLIKAIKGTGFKLKIIGDPAPNHLDYLEKCKAIADEDIEFIPRISQEELVKYYLESEIHIQPSWFETTGLSSLEGGYLGCKVIVSPNGDTRDYFKDMATYCEPNSMESIKQAILETHEKEYSNDLKNMVEKEYNWEQAAKKTYEVYCVILKDMK